MKRYAALLLLSLIFQSKEFLLAAPENPPQGQAGIVGRRIASQALAYRGTRYRFGGRSKRGLDCSGLISRVWEDLNLGKLPPQCSVLFKLGRPIEPEEVQAGDLIFFENTYRRGISHVGIYTENDEFIHASGPHRGVTVSKLTHPYYLRRIAGGRRLYKEAP